MAESRHDDQQDEQSENQASKDIEGAANQPNMHNKRLGRLGEDVAARYLVSRGYDHRAELDVPGWRGGYHRT